MNLARFIPFLSWLPSYDRGWLERASQRGLLGLVGADHVFLTVDLAVHEIEGTASRAGATVEPGRVEGR